jgi:hypothetical protein
MKRRGNRLWISLARSPSLLLGSLEPTDVAEIGLFSGLIFLEKSQANHLPLGDKRERNALSDGPRSLKNPGVDVFVISVCSVRDGI